MTDNSPETADSGTGDTVVDTVDSETGDTVVDTVDSETGDTVVDTVDSETGEAAVDSAQSSSLEPPSYHPPAQERFDWRGWVLVGIIVFSFLVVPGAILYLPHAQGLVAAWGISWTQAYLALPMIPALLLGATAIWAAVSSRSL